MDPNSLVTLHAEPVHLSLSNLDDAIMSGVCATGIVNPFGPTLIVIAIRGKLVPGETLPIWRWCLHPFGSSLEELGTLRCGISMDVTSVISEIFADALTSCPSLVVLPAGLLPIQRLATAKAILKPHAEEAPQVLQFIRAFPGNPWDRITAEMNLELPEGEMLEPSTAVSSLAEALIDRDHSREEFKAFCTAWTGSIEQTGQDTELDEEALSLETMLPLLLGKLLDSLDFPLPNGIAPPDPEPATGSTSGSDTDELSALLHAPIAEVLEALKRSALRYGTSQEKADVRRLSRLYQLALQKEASPEQRTAVLEAVTKSSEAGRCHPMAYIPFLVFDDDMGIVSRATIDMVCNSDYLDGTLYALKEIEALMRLGTIENRGAVLGALIAMGDEETCDVAERLRSLLDVDEINAAARVHTGVLQHSALQFWLKWATYLVRQRSTSAETLLGSVASALVLAKRRAITPTVVHSKRRYPCRTHNSPIALLKQWSIVEYAALIAPTLREIESLEAQPKLFGQVMSVWGISARPKRKSWLKRYLSVVWPRFPR